MKKYVLLLLLALFVNTLRATDVQLPQVLTPNVANIFSYGGVETSLFSGKMQYSVPLYTIHDEDFDLPISLEYCSDGFKPLKHSGPVGYNWSLMASGVITREVNRVPDEVSRTINGFTEQGMYYYLSRTNHNQIPDKNDVFELDENIFHDGIYGHNIKETDWLVDYIPDLFHFNFCGYRGTFMINNHGKPVVISGDIVDIDLSHLATNLGINACVNPIPNDTQSVKITTNDGYVYEFGGNLSSLEYTLQLPKNHPDTALTMPYVNAWHLRKITAPNKRFVEFFYRAGNSNNMWIFNETYNLYIPAASTLGKKMDYYQTKDVVLDSIHVSGSHMLRVIFHNSPEFMKMFTGGPHSNACYKNYQLDSVCVICDGAMLHKSRMTYNYMSSFESWHHWRFLASVHRSDNGEMTFAYNSGTIPDLSNINSSAYFTYIDLYGYLKDHSLLGQLRKIDFPTGGYVEFTYEKHRCGQQRYWSLVENSDIEWKTNISEFFRDGARISRIDTYSEDGELIERKSYSYTHPNGNSSGIFFDKTVVHLSGNQVFLPMGRWASLFDSHIGYSHVCERTSCYPSGQQFKTEYIFETGATSYSTLSDPDLNYHLGGSQVAELMNMGMYSFQTQLAPVGKLFSKTIYKGNVLQQKTVYGYNNTAMAVTDLNVQPLFERFYTDTIIAYLSSMDSYAAKRMYVCPDVTRQKVVFDYFNDRPVETKEFYKHDCLGRITMKVSDNSDGKRYFESYRYPDEFTAAANSRYTSQGLYLLTRAHRINKPVETISGYIGSGNQQYVTSGRIELYKSNLPENIPMHAPAINIPGPVVPGITTDNMYVYHFKTLNLKVANPLSDYVPATAGTNGLTTDSRYYPVCSYVYNDKQRLTSITPAGQPTTSYVWDDVWLQSATTGNQTTSYTHIPYVGPSSITDARGNTLYYTYDSANRLKEIYRMRNGNKEILKAYDYHMENE